MESLQLKPGEVIYKCPKCCSIKPERAHHCRSERFVQPRGSFMLLLLPVKSINKAAMVTVLKVLRDNKLVWTGCDLTFFLLLQYLQALYPQDGSPLSLGQQLCRREEPALLRPLHCKFSYCHVHIFIPHDNQRHTTYFRQEN